MAFELGIEILGAPKPALEAVLTVAAKVVDDHEGIIARPLFTHAPAPFYGSPGHSKQKQNGKMENGCFFDLLFGSTKQPS